jgi:hypothetical protein
MKRVEMRPWSRLLLIAAAVFAQAAVALEPSLQYGTVMEAAERLKAGEFLWAPDIAPEGPVLLVVSLATQRAVVYRNGVPIGITTVSTGRPGYSTPTGVFTILQKHVEHYSSLYDDAPMPYMQRLTWGGVALHGGSLPGYPASHGCIRLPHEFARLLYGVTHLGMTVIVTNDRAVPRVAPGEVLLSGTPGRIGVPQGTVVWEPERSPTGPVSIVVSTSDRRVVVLRNGVTIGSSPVATEGPISQASAFVLSRVEGQQRTWLRIALPGQSAEPVEPPLRGRITVPEAFRRAVEGVLAPGTTVVVSGDSLEGAGTNGNVTVIEDDGESPSARQ